MKRNLLGVVGVVLAANLSAQARPPAAEDRPPLDLGMQPDSSVQFVCQTAEVIARRTYTDSLTAAGERRDPGQWRNGNGLNRDQQSLADALACKREDELVFRSGIDFTSVDGFDTKGTDLRASVAYNIVIGARKFPLIGKYRISRYTVTLMADRSSEIVERIRFGCSAVTRDASTYDPSRIPDISTECATSEIGADSTQRVFYVPTRAPFRSVERDVRGVWAGSALFRWETPTYSNTSLMFGPAFELSIATDPAMGTPEGLLTRAQGGLTVRQFGASNRERFSALILYGTQFHYREREIRYDSAFVQAHPEVGLFQGSEAVPGAVRNVIGSPARASTGFSLRMLFQPFPEKLSALYLRGAVSLPDRGYRASSLAVLLQGDLGTILNGILGTPAPPEQAAGGSNNAAPTEPLAPPNGGGTPPAQPR